MKNIKKHFIISELLSKYLLDKTQPIDKELENWLNADEHNRETFGSLNSDEHISDLLHEYEQIDLMQGWYKTKARIAPHKTVLIYFKKIMRVAAMLAVPVCILTYLYFNDNNIREKTRHFAHVDQVVLPGTSKAMLILSSGEKVDLETAGNTSLMDIDGTKIINQSKSLNYNVARNNTDNGNQIVYNTLVIPKGGEYRIILPDSTVVWLNSESVLKYPTKFSGNKREVFLEGEAFFEVASIPLPKGEKGKMPFIVKVKDMIEVKVLGTHFNLMAYSNEPEIQTTLVEGRVEVSSSFVNNSVILAPGQQARLSITAGGGEINVADVNTNAYTLWKNGTFFFDNESLESIARKLNRWYNVDITFDKESIKHIRFFGKIKRYETINQILDMIKKTEEIDYTIENNAVIIY